jgi:hypothetical protein
MSRTEGSEQLLISIPLLLAEEKGTTTIIGTRLLVASLLLPGLSQKSDPTNKSDHLEYFCHAHHFL